MAVAARRTSKAIIYRRRTHYNVEVPGMNPCPNCGELKKSHHVCPACGQYDGKEVISKEA
ncbi:MAG: 50S ribosomal protein L32 [Carnobacterium sp.]